MPGEDRLGSVLWGLLRLVAKTANGGVDVAPATHCKHALLWINGNPTRIFICRKESTENISITMPVGEAWLQVSLKQEGFMQRGGPNQHPEYV